MRGLTAILVLAAACAGGDGSHGPEGRWGVHLASGCEAGVRLDDDGSYRWTFLACALQGGGVGGEVEDGTYTYTDTAITFVPEVTSCPRPDSAEVWSMGYELGPDSLRLSGLNGVLTLQTAGGTAPAGFVGLYGCWDDDLFTPGSLEPVR